MIPLLRKFLVPGSWFLVAVWLTPGVYPAAGGVLRPASALADERFPDRIRILRGDQTAVQVQVMGGDKAAKQVKLWVLDEMYDYTATIGVPMGWTKSVDPKRPRELIFACSGVGKCLTGSATLTVTVPLRRRDPSREEIRLSGRKERKIAKMAEKDVLAQWRALGLENYEVQVTVGNEDGSQDKSTVEVEIR